MIKTAAASPLALPIAQLLARLRAGEMAVADLARAMVERIMDQAGTPTYLALDETALSRDAERLDRKRRSGARLPPLFGLPVSVKDIFDVRGEPTSAGSKFLPPGGRPARRDAGWVSQWRKAGVLLIGKTHLNEFAYGITGENPWWGPCRQPDRPDLLTGGSSSGAAASVQGATAAVGLGTDTGGSIRVPAALCGLVGFRASLGSVDLSGMIPLAPRFDTCGWLQRNLEDFPLVFAGLNTTRAPRAPAVWRIGFWEGPWLDVGEAKVLATYRDLARLLARCGARVQWHRSDGLKEAGDLFAPMQAYEAARHHRRMLERHRLEYDPAVRARLDWGASIKASDYHSLRQKSALFCRRLNLAWRTCDLMIAPACPFLALNAREDQAARRGAILQLTTPFSLGGLPALTFPWGGNAPSPGWQIIAPHGEDGRLVSFAATLARWLKAG